MLPSPPFSWVFFALLLFSPTVHSSRILAVFPTVSKSHFDFFQPLLLALASRGHDVTVVNSYPQPRPVRNYTDINLQDFKKVFFNNIPFDILPQVPTNFIENHRFLLSQIEGNELTFSHPDVRRLVNSDEKFDLIITELWNNDVFLGFAHKFKAPVIAMSSCSILPWGNARFGNPDNPSYIPQIFFRKYGKLDILHRIINTCQLAISQLLYKFVYNPISEKIARRGFGDSLPPLEELALNTSLLFVNTHHTLHGSRPLSPQVIQIGGIHVKKPKPLRKDLDRWMNESADGVVYFSFGSMLRGATLPEDKVRAFIDVFRTLPQRVLWKWEDDSVAGLPQNVKLMKWLPQRDVLAHPKVKVFISHGGLLGTTEAVVSGVPILGIPMYGDQPNNVAALVENKVAIHVDYNNISVASLSYALNTLINDKSYAENAKKLSERFLDRPQSPLDTAVYWTEYVIRHGGAPHLQSAAVHLTWYQYYLLDVIAVCLASLAATVATVVYIIKTSLRVFCSRTSSKMKVN
uniref:UDP-glucuronosyltransferase n=1 Tax=Homalodisca liturata TaxID=320908 RepID=A0A1B6K0J6_9HEMI